MLAPQNAYVLPGGRQRLYCSRGYPSLYLAPAVCVSGLRVFPARLYSPDILHPSRQSPTIGNRLSRNGSEHETIDATDANRRRPLRGGWLDFGGFRRLDVERRQGDDRLPIFPLVFVSTVRASIVLHESLG